MYRGNDRGRINVQNTLPLERVPRGLPGYDAPSQIVDIRKTLLTQKIDHLAAAVAAAAQAPAPTTKKPALLGKRPVGLLLGGAIKKL